MRAPDRTEERAVWPDRTDNHVRDNCEKAKPARKAGLSQDAVNLLHVNRLRYLSGDACLLIILGGTRFLRKNPEIILKYIKNMTIDRICKYLKHNKIKNYEKNIDQE